MHLLLCSENKKNPQLIELWGSSGAAACIAACAKIEGTPCGRYAVSCCFDGYCDS